MAETSDPDTTVAAPLEADVREVEDLVQGFLCPLTRPKAAEIASDSGIGSERDDESTRTASLTSSITGYKYENGRRYHSYREGQYFLPNDDAEQDRLDLTHHICRLLLDGGLYKAPLTDPKRCLDLGTGTGIWAIDFADEFPKYAANRKVELEANNGASSEIIGTDLSPIQPSWVPPNLRFLVDDMESSWDYSANEAFDYIHQRSLGGSIKDWPNLFQQIYKNLKPGGYTEMQEYEGVLGSMADPSTDNAPNVKQLIADVNKAAEMIGRKVNVAPDFKEMMETAGFVDVKQQVIQVPIGTWAKGAKWKEIGLCQREQFIDGMNVYAVGLFTRVLGWQLEEVQVLLGKANAEIREPKNQLYIPFHFVVGRKPDA